MFLVELVMQGVRGIRDLARLRFQSGFNFVAAGNESGKTSSVDSMLRLLFPSSQSGSTEPFLSRYAPDASRAALVVFSDDKTYYRVIQDFSKRAVNLSKYNGATKEFGLIHKDWDSTAQFMAGLTAGMTEDEFGRLFIFRREHYAARSGSSVTSAPSAPRSASIRKPSPAAGVKATSNEARLAQLRETLRRAEEAADADYRAQSAKLRLDEIMKKLDRLKELDLRASEIEVSLAELKGCSTLPDNLGGLMDEHERRQAKKIVDSDELTKEIEGLKMQLSEIPSVNLVTDKLFILGAVFGGLSVIAGLFILTSEQAHFFPLGVLVALLLIAVAWYKGQRKNAERKQLMMEEEMLRAELGELERNFEEGGSTIMACMKATDSTTTRELKDKADNYRYFLSLRQDIEDQRKHALGSSTVEDLQAEFSKLQQESIDLEKAARAVAQYAGDTYSIRQDIERIESETSAEAPMDFGGEGQELFTGFAAPSSVSGQGGFLSELGIASRIGGIETETLMPAVEAAAQRNLSAVTTGKYIRIEIGSGGDPVVHLKDESKLNFSDLSHGTRDLVYFCLRTGLIEAISGKRRLPFVLDDPLASFDPARQRAACQILRALGAKTQVILFTSNPALRAGTDAAAELK
ncbi:MAG TPA: hypothetical protein VFG02_01450 [Nitrospirota bacterium]|nr:hypothetical protein [Nitrospirota bacterium]